MTVLGFCQAIIITNVQSLASIFPSKFTSAVFFGQAVCMLVAACLRTLVVYEYLTWQVPMGKMIGNLEGIQRAIVIRQILYFVSQLVVYMIGLCATKALVKSKFTAYHIEEAYSGTMTDNNDLTSQLLTNTSHEIEEEVISSAAQSLIRKDLKVLKL